MIVYNVILTLSSKGLKESVKEIVVDEKNMTYVGDGVRIKKSDIGVIKSKFSNSISMKSKYSFFCFNAYVVEETSISRIKYRIKMELKKGLDNMSSLLDDCNEIILK